MEMRGYQEYSASETAFPPGKTTSGIEIWARELEKRVPQTGTFSQGNEGFNTDFLTR